MLGQVTLGQLVISWSGKLGNKLETGLQCVLLDHVTVGKALAK